MKLFAGIAFATLLIAPVAHADEKANVQNLADVWLETYNKGDAAGVAKLYTHDATYATPFWTASGQYNLKDAFARDIALGSRIDRLTLSMRGAKATRLTLLAHGPVTRRARMAR